MAIQVGDKLPETKFRVMTAEGPQVRTTDDVFKGKKVALFAVPGAYTGTCHKMHLPSIFPTSSAASSCSETLTMPRTFATPRSTPTSFAGSAAFRTATTSSDAPPRPKKRPSWTAAAFRDDITVKRGCRFCRPEYCTGRPPGLRPIPPI